VSPGNKKIIEKLKTTNFKVKTVKINEDITDDENNTTMQSFKVNAMDKEGNHHYKIQ
jgi:hypothetical protein